MCCACDGGEWVIPGEEGDEKPDEEEEMCFDTNFDSDGNVLTDNWSDGCEQYNNHPGWCGKYNNDVFKSDEMCCICNGGRNGTEPEPVIVIPPISQTALDLWV